MFPDRERESECVYACELLFCHFAGVKVSKCKRIVKKVCALFLFMYIKLLHFNLDEKKSVNFACFCK
jgi:hypothetical protein